MKRRRAKKRRLNVSENKRIGRLQDSVGHELNVYSSTPTYGNYGLDPAARYAKQQAEIEKKPRKPITITLPDGHVCDLSEKILLIQE